jgi:hypothetical protein
MLAESITDDEPIEQGRECCAQMYEAHAAWEQWRATLAPGTQEARQSDRWYAHLAPPVIGTLEFWRRQMADPPYVYFATMIDGRGGSFACVKIGLAVDPMERLLQLQTGNPIRLILEAVVLSTPRMERQLHRHYRHMRGLGEWFIPNEGSGVLTDRAHEAANAQLRKFGSCGQHYLRTDLIKPILMPDEPR